MTNARAQSDLWPVAASVRFSDINSMSITDGLAWKLSRDVTILHLIASDKDHVVTFRHRNRKTEKRNVFADARDDKKEDNMDDWDEDKLQEVVNKKHGEKNGLLPASSIVCKFFLEAVESGKYGWFWDCPNGTEKCQYRHALPPG